MPIVQGKYVAPTFVNGSSPAINASELNAMAQTLQQVGIENGGTGATSAAAARTALGITPANIGALATSGGTISGNLTVSGSLTVGTYATTVPISAGGTGQTTVAGARNALGLGNTSGALPIANGGTGQSTVEGVRNALGLGNTSGALPIANGGTGATTVAAARNALGLGNTGGALPMANGGTGASAGTIGLKNLLADGPTILSNNQYGVELPTGVIQTGMIFFKKI